ncbi:hypothetical protein NFI96_002544 [Prochilodus magdalenae]|nr:hypothetical protein NFI96_002544 [Prochilodus magdalenae]
MQRKVEFLDERVTIWNAMLRMTQDINGNDCQEEMSKMVLGIFVVRHERAEPTHDPEDIGIVLVGLESVRKQYERVHSHVTNLDLLQDIWDGHVTDDVLHLLESSNPMTYPLDPIPSTLLQSISLDLLPFSSFLINFSLSSGHVPQAFKTARVFSILKKPLQDSSDISSYRPMQEDLDGQLSFSARIATLTRSCRSLLYNIRRIQPFLSQEATQLLVQSLVISRCFTGINPVPGFKISAEKVISKKTGKVVEKKKHPMNPNVRSLLRKFMDFDWLCTYSDQTLVVKKSDGLGKEAVAQSGCD